MPPRCACRCPSQSARSFRMKPGSLGPSLLAGDSGQGHHASRQWYPDILRLSGPRCCLQQSCWAAVHPAAVPGALRVLQLCITTCQQAAAGQHQPVQTQLLLSRPAGLGGRALMHLPVVLPAAAHACQPASAGADIGLVPSQLCCMLVHVRLSAKRGADWQLHSQLSRLHICQPADQGVAASACSTSQILLLASRQAQCYLSHVHKLSCCLRIGPSGI